MDKLLALTFPGENNSSQTIQINGAVQCTANCFNVVVSWVVSIAFAAAIILALAFLIWGGIDIITSQGDKTKIQKARMKLIYAIIGLVLTFFSYLIVNSIGLVLGVKLLG